MENYKIKYEVLEDTNGGVHMAILKNNNFAAIITNIEEVCNQPDGYGWIQVLIGELEDDPTCWEKWAVYEPVKKDDASPQDVYRYYWCNGDLVAWGYPCKSEEYWVENMGNNAAYLLASVPN